MDLFLALFWDTNAPWVGGGQCFSQKGIQVSYGRPLLGKIHSKFTESFKKITRNMLLGWPTFNFWLKAWWRGGGVGVWGWWWSQKPKF